MKRSLSVSFAIALAAFLFAGVADAAARCVFTTDLAIGSAGAPVACLQRMLLDHGIVIPAGATGYFGSQTKAAVSLWQSAHGVTPNSGYFGPLSRIAYVFDAPTAVKAPTPVRAASTVVVRKATKPSPVKVVKKHASPHSGTSAPNAPTEERDGDGKAETPTPSPTPTPAPTPSPTPTPEPKGDDGSSTDPAPTTAPTEETTPSVDVPADEGVVLWKCDFEDSYCGMYEQSKVEPDGHRSSFVGTARNGERAVMLTTMPGDDEVHGSGYWERDDLSLGTSPDYCNEGQEEWWAMSVLFPDSYVVPKEGGAVMDFHHNASGGQANFHFLSQPTGLRMHGFYGDVSNPEEYKVDLGPVVRDQWYDLVYHVKWSSGDDGYFVAWMNGKKVLDHEGPTLYKGISCYLKLANYHDPFGESSSIIFDRVMRGTSAQAVSRTPLEE
ncbi:MAG TPA: heparin lyase I family protein [Candidatus Paceibacterota bacterium]|nr:heparin lyase I family protein [Candidatus Paceibacterota bacterium]